MPEYHTVNEVSSKTSVFPQVLRLGRYLPLLKAKPELSDYEIARQLNSSRSAVQYARKRLGFQPSGNRPGRSIGTKPNRKTDRYVEVFNIKPPLSDKEVAEKLGVTVQAVGYIRRRWGFRPPPPRNSKPESIRGAIYRWLFKIGLRFCVCCRRAVPIFTGKVCGDCDQEIQTDKQFWRGVQ